MCAKLISYCRLQIPLGMERENGMKRTGPRVQLSLPLFHLWGLVHYDYFEIHTRAKQEAKQNQYP